MAAQRLGLEPLGSGLPLSRSRRLSSQTLGENLPNPAFPGRPRAPPTSPYPVRRRSRGARSARLRGGVTSGRPTGSGGGGGGEEGEVRRARRGWRGGAGRRGLRGTLTAPPRPALVSLGRLAGAGQRRGRCLRGVRTWQQPGGASLAGPPAGRRRLQSRGSLPEGSSCFWAAQARPPNPRPCLCSLPALPTSLLCRCSGSAQVQGLSTLSPQGGRGGWWPEVPCPC